MPAPVRRRRFTGQGMSDAGFLRDSRWPRGEAAQRNRQGGTGGAAGPQALLVGIHSNVTRRKDDKPHTLFLVIWISFG